MAAAPGKRKPPTPPKPPLGRLTGQNLIENPGDSSKERCSSSVQGKEKAKDNHIYDEIEVACKETIVERNAPTLKTKTDDAQEITSSTTSGIAARELGERTHCVDVIKCSSDKLLPKPPLLPKPQTSPKVLASSPKFGSCTRPLVPKRPNLVPSTERNGKEPPISSVQCTREKPLLKSTATNTNHGGVASQLTGGIAGRRLPTRAPLHIKAPVAKLDEFDSFCESVKSESPVRPPRSPKNQPFKGEPFTVFEEKPELPAKKKQWTCNPASGGNFEALRLHWQTTKEKSASLGRTNAFRYVESKSKSSSLGRNKITEFASYIENEEELLNLDVKNTPVPPPRQRKKQCAHARVIPVYAEVNYSLKKNRRKAAEQPKETVEECSECIEDEEEVQEQTVAIEGRLLLPGARPGSSVSNEEERKMEDKKEEEEKTSEIDIVCESNLISNEPNEIIEETSVCEENGVRSDKCGVNCETSDTLNSGHLMNGCVISQDKVLSNSASDFIKVDNNDYFSHQTCSVDNRTKDTDGRASPSVEIEFKSHVDESSTSTLLPTPSEEKCSESCLEWSSAEAQEDSTSGKVEWHLAKLSIHDSTSEKIEWQSAKISPCESTSDAVVCQVIEENNSELYRIINSRTEKVCKSEVTVTKNSETVGDVSVNNTDSVELRCKDLVNANEGKVSPQIEATVSRNPDSSNIGCRLSTSSLPSRRKLEMKELGKLHRRRQSWSNSKDDSPSPEKTPHRVPNVHKRKSKSRSWWCDEGELSSGALGDLDSSDNTARQSSFEEVDWTGSDVEDGPGPVRSKLSCWLGSFGKGNRKLKIRRDSNSQFYCDSQENGEQTLRENDTAEAPNLEVTQSLTEDVHDVEVDSFNSTVLDGSRPPSGLSALSALDIDQKSDAPVSEESFEIYPHSESENEAEGNVENRESNECQSEETRQAKKAFYIAQELMTSERVFIDVIKLLSVDFRQTVRTISSEQKYPVIPDAELSKILNSLPQLQSLNEDLLRDLEHRINNWDSIKKIADVIVRKGPFLKLYTSYIQNFESQCSYLEECCQKYPRFAKVVKEFEASPRCQKLSLKHYMLKPVQRIPQYRLLLEDYLHHLSPSSPDLEDTRTALKIVCDVADHANRSIKLGDHLSKLLQLQSQLGNYEVIKPGRMFLKDGELFKLSRKGMQPRYFILLNDCLLYTSYYGSVQSSGLKVNYELPLNSMKVNIPQAEDYHNEFSIISVKRSFTLSARSLSERQEWVDALQKAITDYAYRQLSFQNMKIVSSSKNEDSSEPFKLGQEAPVWIQDRRVTMCQSCTAEFTVTFRRHHCRACGKVVCGDCSDFRAPLQYKRFESARVCEECYDTLLKEAKDPTSKLNQAMKLELGNVVRITDTFKRLGPASGRKVKKFIPQRLKEVTANDSGSQMSGWLQRRSRRSWKRLWFVIKEQVLYVYKASEDVVALESIPVLGYIVEPMKERHFQLYEGIDAKLVFQLAHRGQHPLIFHADNEHLANRWITAMNEATVLK